MLQNILNKVIGAAGGSGGGEGGMYNDWPLAKFAFRVNIGGFDGELAFETMDGLGATVAKMEYRDANSPKFYKQHRPTLTSYDPVTLKKGMFAGDSTLFDWFKNVSSGSLFGDSRDVVIDLIEIGGSSPTVMFSWTLEKAYVTKFTPPSLDGGADSEAAVEELELSYQTFSATGNLSFGAALGALTNAASSLPNIPTSIGGNTEDLSWNTSTEATDEENDLRWQRKIELRNLLDKANKEKFDLEDLVDQMNTPEYEQERDEEIAEKEEEKATEEAALANMEAQMNDPDLSNDDKVALASQIRDQKEKIEDIQEGIDAKLNEKDLLIAQLEAKNKEIDLLEQQYDAIN